MKQTNKCKEELTPDGVFEEAKTLCPNNGKSMFLHCSSLAKGSTCIKKKRKE